MRVFAASYLGLAADDGKASRASDSHPDEDVERKVLPNTARDATSKDEVRRTELVRVSASVTSRLCPQDADLPVS